MELKPGDSAPDFTVKDHTGKTHSLKDYRGKTLRETGQIPTPYFPAGLAYGHTPKGDRIYVANNLSGVAGATNPPGRTVTVIDPKTKTAESAHE